MASAHWIITYHGEQIPFCQPLSIQLPHCQRSYAELDILLPSYFPFRISQTRTLCQHTTPFNNPKTYCQCPHITCVNLGHNTFCCEFLWAKRLDEKDIHLEMFPLYGGKCSSHKLGSKSFTDDKETETEAQEWLRQ
jgi:hypothetical protein